MKKHLTLLSLCLIALLFNSCKKGSSNNATPPYYITFKADGVKKTTTNVIAALVAGKLNNQEYQSLNFQGWFGDNESLAFGLYNPTVGTYNVSPGFSQMDSFQTGASYIVNGTSTTGTDFFLGDTGTLIITSITSTTITGTFQFSCSNNAGNPIVTRKITEGKFNLHIITK